MRILVAEHLGMCFGVRDAINLAHAEGSSRPLTILGELVHNRSVQDTLRERGVQVETEPEKVSTDTVMITAHGTSNKMLSRLRDRGLEVVEATCPLVKVAHRAVERLVAQGCFPVIIGHAGHVEVRGLTGDLQEFAMVLTEDDVDALPERARYGVVAQTTLPIDRVQGLVELIRIRRPESEVRFVDTVCQPTKHRQSAATTLARQSDVVVVIGGANSNNTRELVQTSGKHCKRVYHVVTTSDLRPEWFGPSDTVGVTAGTSTPDHLIDAVKSRLESYAAAMTPAVASAAC